MPNQNKLQNQNKTPFDHQAMGLRSGSRLYSSPSVSTNDRLDALSKLFNDRFDELMGRLDLIEGRVTCLANEVQAINERVAANDANIAAVLNRVAELEYRIAVFHENAVACDLILRGLPITENENLDNVFSSLCESIKCDQPEVINIFRTKNPRDSVSDAPVIIKLKSTDEKVRVLKSAATFRKQHGTLKLTHVRINSTKPIYLNESLSNEQQQILNTDVRHKKTMNYGPYLHYPAAYILDALKEVRRLSSRI